MGFHFTYFVSVTHVSQFFFICRNRYRTVGVMYQADLCYASLEDLRSATSVVARRVSCNRGSEAVVRCSSMVRLQHRGRSI